MFEDLDGALVAFILGVLLLSAAFVLGIMAAWSVGPIQTKLAVTAVICGVPGFFCTLIGSDSF